MENTSNADESTVWASSPFVKVSDSESDAFFDFIDSENNYWTLGLFMSDGELIPSYGDKTTDYTIASVQYNKPSPI